MQMSRWAVSGRFDDPATGHCHEVANGPKQPLVLEYDAALQLL